MGEPGLVMTDKHTRGDRLGDIAQNPDDVPRPKPPRKGKGQRLCKPLTCSFLGGDEGARTLDPRLAKPMLSQLSYVPVTPAYSSIGPGPPPRLAFTGPGTPRYSQATAQTT
jgi:hypothetical protein